MTLWPWMQDFDPIGVGARDLREWFAASLKAFDFPAITLAHQVVPSTQQVQANQLRKLRVR